MRTCPQCNGEKRVWVDEPGHPQGGCYDACYHCGNTGEITEEQHQANRLEGVAEQLAIRAADDQRRAANSNEDGEGWAFMAAENGLHEHEYTQVVTWGLVDRIKRQLQEVDPQLLRLIVDYINPEPEYQAMLNVEHVARCLPVDDDIPF